MITAEQLKEPNNLRNRYRRMHAAHVGYGWAALTTFREWVNFISDTPEHKATSYSAPPHPKNDPVTIGGDRHVHCQANHP